MITTTIAACLRARETSARAPGYVEQARVERVRRETEERHPDAVRAQVGDLPGEARMRDPGTVERGDRLRST